jgi:hypothetical protein
MAKSFLLLFFKKEVFESSVNNPRSIAKASI